MPRLLATLMISMFALIFLTESAFSQDHRPRNKGADGTAHGSAPADLNQQFLDPKMDVTPFVQRFEGADREIFTQREALLRLADVKPGQAVADIGAGTGLFCWPFARQVGARGQVYALDIAPAFLDYLTREAQRRGFEKIVKPVRGSATSTNLAAGSIDVAFVCATYHHFEKPEAMLASIHQALRPGGRLVVIDFDLRSDSTEHVRKRARAPREVYFREMEKAGFVRLPEKTLPDLRDNFAAVFRKETSPPDSKTP